MPLAGPEYFGPNSYVKGLQTYKGNPVLWQILQSRPWADQVLRYSFILRDLPEAHEFAKTYLLEWFPGSQCVFLSRETAGALPSALSGAGCFFQDSDKPLIVDLADIDFTLSDFDVHEVFAQTDKLGGVIPAFQSTSANYSYMLEDENGAVVRTAEKQVISQMASAGCYLFCSLDLFLQTCGLSLNDAETYSYKGLFYLCPSFNAVIAQDYLVKTVLVHDVVDVRVG